VQAKSEGFGSGKEIVGLIPTVPSIYNGSIDGIKTLGAQRVPGVPFGRKSPDPMRDVLILQTYLDTP
jgi:hypothetical protein